MVLNAEAARIFRAVNTCGLNYFGLHQKKMSFSWKNCIPRVTMLICVCVTQELVLQETAKIQREVVGRVKGQSASAGTVHRPT